jgi:hypothetical protein
VGKVKVRMIASMAGPDESFQPGQEYDVDEQLAKAWCTEPAESPRAVYVNPPKPKRQRKPKAEAKAAGTPEAAVREEREKAVQPPPAKR